MPPGYRRANKAGHCGHAMPINAVLFLHPMSQPSSFNSRSYQDMFRYPRHQRDNYNSEIRARNLSACIFFKSKIFFCFTLESFL